VMVVIIAVVTKLGVLAFFIAFGLLGYP
jgi:hypothetical protein